LCRISADRRDYRPVSTRALGNFFANPRVAMILRDEASHNAVRTPTMDLPIAQEVIEAVKRARKDVVLLPTMVGSVESTTMVEFPSTRRQFILRSA
jgi:hypothetical protein